MRLRFLLVEYPDRLARFGFPYLKTLFDVLGVRVVVAAGQEAEDAPVELVKDLLSIVTRFSAKWYGKRGGRRRGPPAACWATVDPAYTSAEGRWRFAGALGWDRTDPGSGRGPCQRSPVRVEVPACAAVTA